MRPIWILSIIAAALAGFLTPGAARPSLAAEIQSPTLATYCLEEMKPSLVDPGKPITVLRRDGSTLEGSFRSVEATRLRLSLKPSGYPSSVQEIDVAAEDVAGVSYWERGERSIANGVIGALVGGVLGYLIGYHMIANPDDKRDPGDFFGPADPRNTGFVMMFPFMGIGYVVGREIGAKPGVMHSLACAPISAAQGGLDPRLCEARVEAPSVSVTPSDSLALSASEPSPSAALSASEPSPAPAPPKRPQRWRAFRPHPGPKSQCGTFALTELTVLRRLESDDRVVLSGERTYGSFDAGLEHNVSSAFALGASGFFGLDEHRTQVGMRLRVRKWFSGKASLDLAPGLILAAKEEKNAEFLGPAVVLRGSLNLSPSFGVTVQKFETQRQQNRFEPVVKERATYVGAQFSSTSGLVGLNAAIILAVAAGLIVLSGL